MKNFKQFTLNEGEGETYLEYVSKLREYLSEVIKMKPEQIDNYINYFDGKGYIKICWQDGYSCEDCVDSLRIEGEIKWYK